MAKGFECLILDLDGAVFSQAGEEASEACSYEDRVSSLEGRSPFNPLRCGSVLKPDRAGGGSHAGVSQHMSLIELTTAQYYEVGNTGTSKLAQQIAEIAAEVLDPVRGGR